MAKFKTDDVNEFMARLNHPLKAEVEMIRSIIKESNEDITEHIKWNAPSFCYRGEDRVTFKLYPTDRVQLVFHRGSKVKDDKDFVFADSTDLLKWVAADRAIVTLRDMTDVYSKKTALAEAVSQWMKATAT